MLFSSTTFLFFSLPIVLILYYTVCRKSRMLQNVFLFLASLLFYAWGEPVFVLVMLLSIFMNYVFGLAINKYKDKKSTAKVILFITVVFNLGILFVFKYLAFVIENINNLSGADFYVPQIALPLGISFFTFQAMSYVIDVYRGEQVQKNPLNVGLYIAFFPQLIAGPIVRYETVAYQIQYRKETFDDFSSGVCRFIIGLSKKVLLANTLAIVADSAFNSDDGNISVAFSWLGAIAYTLQIFFDFSGYSDMAIGLGRMFGFKFLENFDYPYISSSITEFWRRW
ncbi:MAG TPA: membrane-bound O-acyltransferase family protein, partial [Ruminococcus sp.]|nr:membrane-bound O-acyltransferase family protein [Ruminococcus sp.]